MKKRTEKFEMPMEAPLLCKLRTKKRPSKLLETDSETMRSSKILKTKHACIVEAGESMRKLLESTPPEGRIAEKGFNSSSHFYLVHKFVPIPEAMKIPAAVDREWEKLEKMPTWQLTKVKSKKEFILEAQKEERTVHFATLMDICHLKKCGVGTEVQKYKDRVVL